MNTTEKLLSFVVETDYQDIPEETIKFTKQLALKDVASMVAGSTQPAGRKIARVTRHSTTAPDEAGVIACNYKTDLPAAVLANATLAHAPELEDDKIIPNEDLAWAISTLPVTFTLAEPYRLSGKEFIEASVVGLEVHNRLASVPFEGMESSIILKTAPIAAAAAAGRAMRLTPQQMDNAFGLAMSGGGIFTENTGTSAHFLDSAFQCVRGFRAAQLAKEGFTGNPDLEQLLSALYDASPAECNQVVADLGEKWKLHNMGIKKYPCCFVTHRYIDTLLEILEQHDLLPDDIEQISIGVGQVDMIADRPNPENTDEAMFSFQHLLGAVLLDRELTFEQLADTVVQDSAYRAASKKVTVNELSEWTQLGEPPKARVEVELATGDTIQHQRETYRGSPEDPLPESAFRDMYATYTASVLPEKVIEETTEEILAIEDAQELQGLLETLTYRN